MTLSAVYNILTLLQQQHCEMSGAGSFKPSIYCNLAN